MIKVNNIVETIFEVMFYVTLSARDWAGECVYLAAAARWRK